MRYDFLGGLLAMSLAVAPAGVAGAATPAPAIGTPVTSPPHVASVFADGADVVIAWNAAKGASGYEVLRAPDPAQAATTVAKLANTSLGFRDKQANTGPQYYQVVAVGAHGDRVPSPWIHFQPPPALAVPKSPATVVPPVASVPTQALSAAPLPAASTLAGPVQAVSPAGPATTAAGAPVPAAVAATTSPVPVVTRAAGAGGPVATGAPAGAPTVITPVPAVTGLSFASKTAASHIVQWACAPAEDVCANGSSGAPSYAYEIWTRALGAAAFALVAPAASPTSDGVNLTATVTAFVAPQTSFRVVRKDPSGAHTQSYADAVFASPAQPQEPTGFAVTAPAPGQVNLAWQAVADAVAYRLFEKGVTAPPARLTGTSTTLSGVSAGSHTYQVATEYAGVGFLSSNLPEASVQVPGPPPPNGVPFLSRAGVGTADTARPHAMAYLGTTSMPLASPDHPSVSGVFGLITGWNGYDGNAADFQSPVAAAHYANVTELGLGRSVACWQWPNTLGVVGGVVPIGMLTFCVTGSHGTPGAAGTPDGAALAQSALGVPDSLAVIVTSPTIGQFFGHFVPDPQGGGTHDPMWFSDPTWGTGWMLSMTTVLDAEGPKYTPHACMACHGGTFDPTTGRVSGASLLPIDPALVAFSAQPGADRAASEESIRSVNAMVAASSPSPAVASYLNGLYNGQVAAAGTVSQPDYVPPGWSQQADLFRLVVKRDCLMCHLTTPAALNFDSSGKFFQNKAAIHVDVCTAHSMPNAQVPYRNFWTSTTTIGNAVVNLGGYMLAALGYNSCP